MVEAVDKIRDTASSHNRLFLVEVMGRDAGDIALTSGIGAGAEEILIPERPDLGIERLINSLDHSEKAGKTSSIIIVAEGKKGMSVMEMREYLNEHKPDYDVRVSVIGHMQRGGTPTCRDRVIATRMGVGAVDALMKGLSNVMIAERNNRIVTVDLTEVLQKDRSLDNELMRVAHISSL